MTDAQIHVKAIIAAALLQSRTFDAETLASPNRSISDHKLQHLKELTDRIYLALTREDGRP